MKLCAIEEKTMLKESNTIHLNRGFAGRTFAPSMSVILMTPDQYITIRCTIQALQRQTVRKDLELIIVCPSKENLALIESDLEPFSGYRIVEIGTFGSMASAQAAGVRAACAAIIAFTEDHCFPEEHWAESLINKHKEISWTGVGPAFYNANPRTLISWANFLMEYGEWAVPLPGIPFRHIPGHNSSYKKAALLGYGSDLEKKLEAESVMQWDLIKAGHAFCIEPAARTYHLNYSVLWPTLPFRFHAGQLFASCRATRWSLARRIIYAFAAPLIPVVRIFRILRTAIRIGKLKMIPGIIPILSVLLTVDGAGEMFGYAFGSRGAAQRAVCKDFHRERYVRADEQAQLKDIKGLVSLRKKEKGREA